MGYWSNFFRRGLPVPPTRPRAAGDAAWRQKYLSQLVDRPIDFRRVQLSGNLLTGTGLVEPPWRLLDPCALFS